MQGLRYCVETRLWQSCNWNAFQQSKLWNGKAAAPLLRALSCRHTGRHDAAQSGALASLWLHLHLYNVPQIDDSDRHLIAMLRCHLQHRQVWVDGGCKLSHACLAILQNALHCCCWLCAAIKGGQACWSTCSNMKRTEDY